MKLKWYGHSCFALTYADGTAIVIDPFDDSVGYPLCDARADAVLCSHDHFDHNYVQSLRGKPQIVKDSAPRAVGGVKIRGLDCFHDDAQGARRGRNIAFILEGDGLRVAHLGDLGHMPTPEAVEVIREVRPHTAIAMHFKTVLCNLPITDEQEFVRLTGAQYLPGELEITPETLQDLPSAAVPLCPSAH